MQHPRAYLWLVALAIVVLLTGCSSSLPPTPPPMPTHLLAIQKVSYSPKTIRVGEQAKLTAIAIDPDNDALVYYWSAQHGKVSQGAQGNTVDYIAPSTSGIDVVEVTVTDGSYIDTRTFRIAVLDAFLPTATPPVPTVMGERPTLPPVPDTPIVTPVPTDTPTPEPTRVPATPMPASTEAPRAVANAAAGVFASPNSNATLIGSVKPGQAVTVVGRSSVGSWLYIQTDGGVRGFVYQLLLDWAGDFQSLLPIAAPTIVTPVAPTPQLQTTPSSDFIGIDFYPIPGDVNGHCSPAPGYTLQISGLGELSPFEYLVDGVLVYRGSGVFGYEYHYPGSQPNAQVVGTVKARDGRSVEKRLFLRRPNC
jgi:hypothetical protein